MPSRTGGQRSRALRMTVEPQAGDDLQRAVSDRIDLFNVAATGLDRWHAVAILLRDADDEISGGILGDVWGGWLHVSHLWVAEAYRGHGHGSALLREVERFARARDCHAVRLESHSFQAPDFYVAHGYRVFAVLEDCPPGHQLVFLRKTLAPEPARTGGEPRRRTAVAARGRRVRS